MSLSRISISNRLLTLRKRPETPAMRTWPTRILQRIFVQRQMLDDPSASPPHFYRYWLPFLARADNLGILADPKPF